MGEQARSRPGRLVAICGIDGSGKTTQAALLADRARAEGLEVRSISFPRYGEGFFAELIERYLRGEFAARAGQVSPYLAALPYACDRWEAAPLLAAWLREADLVICNRYVPANMAHQGSKLPAGPKRRAFFDWVERLEYDVFRLPRPDLHVLLDVPVSVAMDLARARNVGEGRAEEADIHERDAAYLEATAAAYRELARLEPSRWAVVQCDEEGSLKPPERIASAVWAAVRQVLYNAGEGTNGERER